MRVLPWTRRHQKPQPDPVAELNDDDVLHLVCCCDDTIARCGDDVTETPWGTEGIPCPLCFMLEDVPCSRCGCVSDCGSTVHRSRERRRRERQ